MNMAAELFGPNGPNMSPTELNETMISTRTMRRRRRCSSVSGTPGAGEPQEPQKRAPVGTGAPHVLHIEINSLTPYTEEYA